MIHLPGTGDEYFTARKFLLAYPLAVKYNIVSIILQVPFYGARRAEGQKSYGLDLVEHTASQILGIVAEANSIVKWLYEDLHHNGSVGFTGISFGGAMTALSSLACPYPHVAVGHVPSNSRYDTFVNGGLSRTVAWDKVEEGRVKVEELLAMINTNDFIERHLLAPVNSKRKFPFPRRVYQQLTAYDDYYVPLLSGMTLYEGMSKLPQLLHHELEMIYGGHISAIALHRQQYMESIDRAFLVLDLEKKSDSASSK